MTNDPMLHERCDDHPEVCRLDRLQGCMYTKGEEEQCAEQTVSSLRPSVVPRSVPRSVQISLQRIPRHCPHLLLLGPNTPNNTPKPGGRSSLFWICNETTYSDTNSLDTYSLHAQASTKYIFAQRHPKYKSFGQTHSKYKCKLKMRWNLNSTHLKFQSPDDQKIHLYSWLKGSF